MEALCSFDVWLHELGYTYNGDAPITGLTPLERDKLQLGWIVRQERKENAYQADGQQSHSQRKNVSHKQDIRERLRRQ